MIPIYYQMARLIHEERIQAAQARRPEWAYAVTPQARAAHASSGIAQLRRRTAQALHGLATRLEPSQPRVGAAPL